MTITVFGASGKVGRLVVEQLLAAGHTVTVFVHSNSPFEISERLRIVKGDVHNAPFVEAAVRGSEAVISTLGSWGTPTKDIVSTATGAIIPAMLQTGAKRLITLTGSGAWTPGDKISIANRVQHAAFRLLAGKIIRDAEDHLRLLADSQLDWTCLRSPVMKQGAPTAYELNKAMPKPWETISRATVAKAIVDQLYDQSYLRSAPHLHASNEG